MIKNVIMLMIIIGIISGIVEGIKDQKKKRPSSSKYSKNRYDEDDLPYYARQLMSEPEVALYNSLCRALPGHHIFTQVQLSRILGVKDGYSEYEWFNKINRMSVDFVVCDGRSNIVACIELDDRSHQRESRKKADAKKDLSLSSAGITIIRWNVRQMPTEWEIVRRVLS
jgi:hypothetical protein